MNMKSVIIIEPEGLQTISVKNSFAFVWVYDFVWVGWTLGNASGHQFGYPALPQWGQNRKPQSGLGGQSESERLSVTTPHHCGWVGVTVGYPHCGY